MSQHPSAITTSTSTTSTIKSTGVATQYFSSSSPDSSNSTSTVAFDRNMKIQQRNNAARADSVWKDDPDRVSYDYFREEIARRLIDRLDDIKRDDGFPLALDIGAGSGIIHRAICSDEAINGVGGIGGVRKLVQLESSQDMLHRDDSIEFEGKELCDSYRMHADEEGTLPFPDGTFDLVISSCALHWINNLPGLFREAHVGVQSTKHSSCLLLYIVICFGSPNDHYSITPKPCKHNHYLHVFRSEY